MKMSPDSRKLRPHNIILSAKGKAINWPLLPPLAVVLLISKELPLGIKVQNTAFDREVAHDSNKLLFILMY